MSIFIFNICCNLMALMDENLVASEAHYLFEGIFLTTRWKYNLNFYY